MSRIPPPTPLLRRTTAYSNKRSDSKTLSLNHHVTTNDNNEDDIDDDCAASKTYRFSRPTPLNLHNASMATSSLEDSECHDAVRMMPSVQTDNIRVVLRIRPLRTFHEDEYEDPLDNNQPVLNNPVNTHRCLDVSRDLTTVVIAPATLQEKRFTFDRVFTVNCSQEDVFQDTGLTAIDNVLNGFNGCIFAYGQTGSGKTYTMLGGNSDGQFTDAHDLKVSPLRGLMPRIFDHLFRRLEDMVATNSHNLEYSVSCTYLEIYNEKIYDLFDASTPQSKSLREDSKNQVFVDSLRHIPITSASQAVEWLQTGSSNRRIAVTDMNRESSRSHAVFTMQLIQTRQSDGGTLMTRRSNLHLVDLAGSEKQKQTKSNGKRLKEAAQINKSLSALGNVIMSLVDVSNGHKRHVHYRDSKLTFLLRDSLGGNAVTTIIATIAEEEKYFSETLSTLKFAQRAKCIKNKAVQNEDSDTMIPLLKEEISRLRQEILELKQNAQCNTYKYSEKFASSSPPTQKKENRWEPVLDVMQRLLTASGAASPTESHKRDGVSSEIRCQRLEMLLYRMLCRYEEHKIQSFTAHRVPVHPHTACALLGAQSLLPQPKRRYRPPPTADCENQVEVDVMQQELVEYTLKCAELESENALLRQQLCEYMNKTCSTPQELSTARDELRVQYEDLVEVLNLYRSVFGQISVALEEKRASNLLRSPTGSASTSIFTEDTSLCGLSTIAADDEEYYIDSDETLEDDCNDLLGTDQEMRRIQTIGIKLDHQVERYQREIERLTNSHLAAQDELETAITAHTFANEQIEQLRRTLAQHDAEKRSLDAEMTALRVELSTSQQQIDELKSQIASLSSMREVEAKKLEVCLERARQENAKLRQTIQYFHEASATHETTYLQQIETLRTENDTLRQRVETSGIVPIGSIKNSVKFIVTEPSNKTQQVDHEILIRRLRAERNTFETRAAQEQQKVRKLEAELARAVHAQASASSFATDLFCSL